MKKYILPVSWTLLIFILSSIPGNKLPYLPFYGFDKLTHFLEYFILGFLWFRALGRKVIYIVLLGIAYGVLDEVHQIFVSNREFSMLDMTFDSLGIISGVLWQLFARRS